MTVAAATTAYETARAAYERASDDLRAAHELESATLLGSLSPVMLTLVRAVSAEFGVGVGDLLGKRRVVEVALPRHCLWAVACEIHGSPSVVARAFGRHTATLHWSVRACRDLARQDARFAARVARVRAALAAPSP